MERIAIATLIAIAALVMTSGLGTNLFAREAAPPAVSSTATSPTLPAGSRVMSLLLTLQALRAETTAAAAPTIRSSK